MAAGSAEPLSFSSSLRTAGSSSIFTSTRSSSGPESRPRYLRCAAGLHEHPSAGPATFAHGHEFPVITRVNRAGSRVVIPDLASTNLTGLQRLAQHVECVAGELGCLVQEQHPAVRQRRRARPRHPAAATAHDRAFARGVMRSDERRAGVQRRIQV